jgi:hypothetical protein
VPRDTPPASIALARPQPTTPASALRPSPTRAEPQPGRFAGSGRAQVGLTSPAHQPVGVRSAGEAGRGDSCLPLESPAAYWLQMAARSCDRCCAWGEAARRQYGWRWAQHRPSRVNGVLTTDASEIPSLITENRPTVRASRRVGTAQMGQLNDAAAAINKDE